MCYVCSSFVHIFLPGIMYLILPDAIFVAVGLLGIIIVMMVLLSIYLELSIYLSIYLSVGKKCFWL